LAAAVAGPRAADPALRPGRLWCSLLLPPTSTRL